MAVRGKSLWVKYICIGSDYRPLTGNLDNHTLYWTRDNTRVIATNCQGGADKHVELGNGLYNILITDAEADCVSGGLDGSTTTVGASLVPVQIVFEVATGDAYVCLGPFSGSGNNHVKGWLQAMMRSDDGVSGDNLPNEINEEVNGTVGGYDAAADSLEALNDTFRLIVPFRTSSVLATYETSVGTPYELPTVAGNLEVRFTTSTSALANGETAYRIIAEVISASGIDENVFVFEEVPSVPGRDPDTYRFVCVATLAYMQELPIGTATAEAGYYCRKNKVDLAYRTAAEVEKARESILDRINALLEDVEQFSSVQNTLFARYAFDTEEGISED